MKSDLQIDHLRLRSSEARQLAAELIRGPLSWGVVEAMSAGDKLVRFVELVREQCAEEFREAEKRKH